MKIQILAVGRLKAGPEKQLADRYLDRFGKAGGQVGLEFGGTSEIVESRAATAPLRQADEAGRLTAHLPDDAGLIVLDERGKNITSSAFAAFVAGFRDHGRKTLGIAIGGPDGVASELRGRADLVLSFGALTWPHQMVRILLAEQLYRAVTILSGHPYHRA